jgi:hypothetical protein
LLYFLKLDSSGKSRVLEILNYKTMAGMLLPTVQQSFLVYPVHTNCTNPHNFIGVTALTHLVITFHSLLASDQNTQVVMATVANYHFTFLPQNPILTVLGFSFLTMVLLAEETSITFDSASLDCAHPVVTCHLAT